MIKNPCIRSCIFNYDEDYCTGCFRRLDDIWDWSKKTNQERLDIIERANQLREEIQNLERPDNAK